ncbi:MAG: GNAT family N-acetyltransferase [Spirochaetota bacterium]
MSNNKYPSEYESRIILKDGSVCLFRPIKKDDADAWLDFYNRLSYKTKYLRFQYEPREMTTEDAVRWCTVDYVNSFAFVAEAIEEQKKFIVAVGRYYRLPSRSNVAEIALVTDDKYHEKGICTKLIERLADVAVKNDIDIFEAFVLSQNIAMRSLFQNYGFHIKKEIIDKEFYLVFPIAKTPEIIRKNDERNLNAAINSLNHILKPKSVAVIGASNKAGTFGQLIFHSIIQNGFSGIVYPVTRSSDSVMSVKAYKSILDVPGDVDVAIIIVPASQAISVTDECGRKRVKGIVVISAGFKERGDKGAELERELRQTAFGYGMRIIGPNCMGLINTNPEVRLNATFSPACPSHGNIAFITQSGALGVGILQYANKLGIGFSNYINVGNCADISSTDMLQCWEKDTDTKVILLYMESIDNPGLFSRVSRRVSETKPVLAIKGGNWPTGSAAGISSASSVSPGALSEALFNQAGIVRVNTIKELFYSATLLSSQPVPEGNRIVIITNGGGPGMLAADACAQTGLILPEISAQTAARLKAAITREIRFHNPLNLSTGVSAQEFENALKILAEDPDYDAIVTLYVPPAGMKIKSIEDSISKAAGVIRQNNKPVVSCFIGQVDSHGKIVDGNYFVPYYSFPEDAVFALSNAVKYGEIIRQDRGKIPDFEDIDRDEGRRIIKSILVSSTHRPLFVPANDMHKLLKCYGILTSESLTAIMSDETEKESNDVGDPSGKPVTKQEMLVGISEHINESVDIIIKITEESSLGHVITFRLGGFYADLLNDTAVRLHPLTDVDARELIESVKMAKLLKGYKGASPVDIRSLEELLLRVSFMVEDIPHISEVNLNPVKVLPNGRGYQIIGAGIMIK